MLFMKKKLLFQYLYFRDEIIGFFVFLILFIFFLISGIVFSILCIWEVSNNIYLYNSNKEIKSAILINQKDHGYRFRFTSVKIKCIDTNEILEKRYMFSINPWKENSELKIVFNNGQNFFIVKEYIQSAIITCILLFIISIVLIIIASILFKIISDNISTMKYNKQQEIWIKNKKYIH